MALPHVERDHHVAIRIDQRGTVTADCEYCGKTVSPVELRRVPVGHYVKGQRYSHLEVIGGSAVQVWKDRMFPMVKPHEVCGDCHYDYLKLCGKTDSGKSFLRDGKTQEHKREAVRLRRELDEIEARLRAMLAAGEIS